MPRGAELRLELRERGNERLGREAAAELAEAAEPDRFGTGRFEVHGRAPRDGLTSGACYGSWRVAQSSNSDSVERPVDG